MNFNVINKDLVNNKNPFFLSDFSIILNKYFNEVIKIYPDLRIVKKDGKGLIVISNYCKDRCNVEVENGKIIKIIGFY